MEGERRRCTFFAHRECEYYPCHRLPGGEELNCLFCYCPLYALGTGCGGNFRYLENGVKDCSDCLLPHSAGGYEYICRRFPQLAELARDKKREP